jgi:hypothetical protein
VSEVGGITGAGDLASCAALYELAITSVVLLGDDAKTSLEDALKQGADQEDASEQA